MKTTRRSFLASAAIVGTVRPTLTTLAQQPVTSGGIGLTVADVQSMYEELPVGQSFRNFAEPETGATLYINFGDTDFAQDIWVYGEITEDQAQELVTWLCPDDIELQHSFEMLSGAGSIAATTATVFTSPFLNSIEPGRQAILAIYTVTPGAESLVEEIVISVAKN